MPDEDFLTGKVEAIKSRFGIVNSVTDTVDVIKDFFATVAEGKPPKIEIHLDNAKSKYNYGGVAYALDMSWYEEYKPTVDVVLSSIIWVFFIWRVFVRLPSIISGMTTAEEISSMRSDIDNGFKPKKRRR